MGGLNSGRYGGRPVVEDCLTLDLNRMLRADQLRDGQVESGVLSWTRGGEPAGSIHYRGDMADPDNAELWLDYRRRVDDAWEAVEQRVRLESTRPAYGGRRWWMLCPYQGHRVTKLHLPPGGDRFASRRAWRLGYRLQRQTARDQLFTRLHTLQAKLGCTHGYDEWPDRPKGMWHRTYERHMERYEPLQVECERQLCLAMGLRL